MIRSLCGAPMDHADRVIPHAIAWRGGRSAPSGSAGTAPAHTAPTHRGGRVDRGLGAGRGVGRQHLRRVSTSRTPRDEDRAFARSTSPSLDSSARSSAAGRCRAPEIRRAVRGSPSHHTAGRSDEPEDSLNIRDRIVVRWCGEPGRDVRDAHVARGVVRVGSAPEVERGNGSFAHGSPEGAGDRDPVGRRRSGQ